MPCKISVLTWDGSNADVTNEVIRILRTIDNLSGYEFDVRQYKIPQCVASAARPPVPPRILTACRESHAVFLGSCDCPDPNDRAATALEQLCNTIGASVHIRGITCPACADNKSNGNKLDVLIMQQLGRRDTGLQPIFARQRTAGSCCADDSKSLQVLEMAFQQASRRRKKLMFVERAAMRVLAPHWKEKLAQTYNHYPQVRVGFLDWTTWTTQLVSSPGDFDVIVADPPESDLLELGFSAIAGTDGIFGCATVGHSAGVYETGCNSRVGNLNGSANLRSAFAAVALFLRHTAGLQQEANDLEFAVHTVLARSGHSGPGRNADSNPGNDSDDIYDSSCNLSALVQQAFADLLDQNHPYHAV